MADCEFCGSGVDVEAQDMDEGRVMMLCASCRANIAAGKRRESKQHTYTEDEALALAWAMYQLGTEHERMYHQTSERNIIDDYTAGYLAAIRGAR